MKFKAAVRIAANKLINPLGFELRRFRYEADSYPLSPQLVEHQIIRLNKSLSTFFSNCPSFLQSGDILESSIREYFNVFRNSPIHQSTGGSGFNAGLLIFLSARLLDPELIIESGTFKGFSSWVLRQACPDAEMHCFDISFAELAYRDPHIKYHEHDWRLGERIVPGNRVSLCFFDDHVSQGKRILEAHELGFKVLIFDDNLPAHLLHRDGTPPVPTLDMLLNDKLEDGERLEWVSAHVPWSYTHDASFAGEVTERIEYAAHAPDLYDDTGYVPANLTLVELGVKGTAG